MELTLNSRETLVEELDEYLAALPSHPNPETVAIYLIEQLELIGEEEGVDEIIHKLEYEGGVDGSLLEVMEIEMETADEFEWTGEEIVTLLERLVGISWFDEDEDDDEDEEEEEEEEEEEFGLDDDFDDDFDEDEDDDFDDL